MRCIGFLQYSCKQLHCLGCYAIVLWVYIVRNVSSTILGRVDVEGEKGLSLAPSVHQHKSCYLKVTLCNNFTRFRYGSIGNWFWYHPQINFDRIWSCEGQINTCVLPTSHPGYALCSSVYRVGIPCKNGRKAFTAWHCQLYCQNTPVSVLASFYQCWLLQKTYIER